MKYGMAFRVEMYDFEREQAVEAITTPGDYIRLCNWADEHLAGSAGSETVSNLRRNYAAAWFALRRLGRLEELGLPEELTVEAVDAMADRLTVYVADLEDDELPLAAGPAR